MKQLSFQYDDDTVIVEYERIDEENNTHFNVSISAERNGEIERFTSSHFRISLSHRDNILSYPVKGPTDLEIKLSLIPALFKQENIDFLF